MQHDGWYGYVYPKSVTLFTAKKLLTPSIAAAASFTLDADGSLYFAGSGGGGGGGYGILLKQDSPLAYEYVLGLLNSKLLDYYLKSISSSFSGGYYAYNRQYIEQLPIVVADKARHDKMVELVARMIELKKQQARAPKKQSPSAKQLLDQKLAITDQQIDALVYELYGLTEDEVRIVEGSQTGG
jgi:hypothetical protein